MADNAAKQRRDRLYQANRRGSRRSYKTELENLQLLLAWEASELSEGQMVKLLDTDRLTIRKMRQDALDAAAQLADGLLTAASTVSAVSDKGERGCS